MSNVRAIYPRAGLVIAVCTLAAVSLHAQDGTPAFPIANGDVNGDGRIDIADSIYLLNWAFSGGPQPIPLDCAVSAAKPVWRCIDGVEVGSSRIFRTDDLVWTTLDTTGVPADYAISIWWVVFNNPELCSDGECGEDDLGNPDVEADVLVGSGGKVVSDGDRQVFSSHIIAGDTSGSYNEIWELGANFGLKNPFGAEFHVVLRSHGPAVPGKIWDQVSTIDGGCEVNLRFDEDVPDEEGECGDIQFVMHQP